MKVPKKIQMHTQFVTGAKVFPVQTRSFAPDMVTAEVGDLVAVLIMSAWHGDFPEAKGQVQRMGSQAMHGLERLLLEHVVANAEPGNPDSVPWWSEKHVGLLDVTRYLSNARTLIQLQVLAFTLPKRGPCRHGCLLEQDVSSARLMLCDANFNRLTSYHPPWMKSQVRCREMECAWPEDWRSS